MDKGERREQKKSAAEKLHAEQS